VNVGDCRKVIQRLKTYHPDNPYHPTITQLLLTFDLTFYFKFTF